MLSHVGQCGQPRPEPVSRTVAPVATIASSQPTAHQATQRNRSGESSSERRRGSDRVADSAFTTRSLEPLRQWVLTCTSLGMLLATVNSGTLIIALPELERSLHTTPLQLVWVILVYMIVSTMLVLTAGRLSDLFGRKNAYVLGFLLFSAASLGAGFAGSGTQLILWRVLPGIGGAFLFANAAALVTDAFPKRELGLAMGTNTMVAAVGLVIGPVLGGALVAISWPWVFWFDLPFGLAGSLCGPGSSCTRRRAATRSADSTCSARRHTSSGSPGSCS